MYLHLLAPIDSFFLLHSREGSCDPPDTAASFPAELIHL